jgi:hypothetical protein
MGDPQQLNRYSYAVNNPLAFRDPSGLACSVLQVLHVLGQAVGDTGTQNLLDALAQLDPQALRQFRDTLASSNVSSDLRQYKWNVVVQLGVALTGTSNSPSATPAGPVAMDANAAAEAEINRGHQIGGNLMRLLGAPGQDPNTPLVPSGSTPNIKIVFSPLPSH